MKIYDWRDVKFIFSISANRTYSQRYYIGEKIKKVLSDDDYVLKKETIDLCLFKSSAMKKIKKMLSKTNFSKLNNINQ